MAKKTYTRKTKKILIKKGTPLPTNKSFKLVTSTTNEQEAEKKANDLWVSTPKAEVKIIHVPKQFLVYGKGVRITKRTPKLR